MTAEEWMSEVRAWAASFPQRDYVVDDPCESIYVDDSRESIYDDDGLVPIGQVATEIASQVPDDDWAKVPRDLARNVDHYLYGAPKVDDTEAPA